MGLPLADREASAKRRAARAAVQPSREACLPSARESQQRVFEDVLVDQFRAPPQSFQARAEFHELRRPWPPPPPGSDAASVHARSPPLMARIALVSPSRAKVASNLPAVGIQRHAEPTERIVLRKAGMAAQISISAHKSIARRSSAASLGRSLPCSKASRCT